MAPLSVPRPKFSLFGRPAARVGLWVDWLVDPYQAAVLKGARAAALEQDAALITFAGGVLGARHENGAFRNHLYQLASPDHLDALIVLGGTLANQDGVEGLSALCEPFRGKPLVSIAAEVPGHSVVQVDNGSGMREAVEHLIRSHGSRRIAFIRGPEANAEAEVRFAAYLEALEKNGVAFDEALVAPGRFQYACGRDAVRLWLDDRRISVSDIDAVVGAADLMVIGALDGLNERGVRVPEDIALVGFDDIEQARFTSPPLSTVRQPLVEQGREAMRLVLAQLRGGAEVGRMELATRFVPRHSCGCFARELVKESCPAAPPRLKLEAELFARRAVLHAELSRASRGSFAAAGAGWEDRLINALADEVQGRSGALVDAYYRLMSSVLSSAEDLGVCHGVIGALRRQLVRAAGEDATALRMVEDLLHELRVVTSDMLERFQAHQRLQAKAWARELSQVSARLVTSFEYEKLEACVREHLPRLGIACCLISRYVEDGRAEVMAGYLEPGGERLPRVRYRAEEVVPRGLLEEGALQLVVMPLLFEQEPFGFAVFALGDSEGHVYEALGEILGAAFRGAGLTALIARAKESGHPMA